MTSQWNDGTGRQSTPTPEGGRVRNERWIRRPRRSTADRKIAGVAGGLGRAVGIDPVLIRVAFVVLTVFGGFGGLLYVLGWLLLPSDGDEVSAAEAMLGRGRSSVPPAMAVGLAIVAVIATFSTFSWGLPFLPLAIGGLVVMRIMHRRGRWGSQDWKQHHDRREWAAGRHDHRNHWMQRTDEQVRYVTGQAQRWAEQARFAGEQARIAGHAARWGASALGPQGGWGGPGGRGGAGGGGGAGGWTAPAGGTSPFDQPAFWDQPAAATRVDRPAPPFNAGVDMNKPASAPKAGSSQEPMDDAAPRTTPPAWDPLGAAPFAWDLPEPTPLPQPSTAVHRRGSGVIARATVGAVLLVGGISAAGVLAGWWALTWAQVSGIALVVLAIGLLISALRGRGHPLIGPGVFLSLVTMALAVTGISGTSGYGVAAFQPTALANEQIYSANAGQLTVDLSQIKLMKDAAKTVTVDLKGGRAEVIVPTGVDVNAHCEARVGQVDCLGKTDDGVGANATNTASATGDSTGTLTITVKVGAGTAQVSAHD